MLGSSMTKMCLNSEAHEPCGGFTVHFAPLKVARGSIEREIANADFAERMRRAQISSLKIRVVRIVRRNSSAVSKLRDPGSKASEFGTR